MKNNKFNHTALAAILSLAICCPCAQPLLPQSATASGSNQWTQRRNHVAADDNRERYRGPHDYTQVEDVQAFSCSKEQMA